MARIWTVVVTLPVLMATALQVSYPLNLQLPPVAHINTLYQFQFAPTTFQSDSNKLQYSLADSPPWLSLDSDTRTLSGTPRVGDAGEVSFTIKAAGAAGAVANMPSKLLVSAAEGPKVKANLSQVLASSGQTSGPKTLAIGPSQPFSISFPMDTFDTDGDSVTYSALLSDRTPLPAWLSLDASSLRFSGTTPPVASQSFDIVLLVSKSPGYSDSSLTFTIAVSTHQLLFKPFSQNIKVDKGADVRITGLKSKLLLDGVPIRDGDIQSINARLPDWLVFDNKTFDIAGKAPSDLMSQNLTVTAKDQFGDSANLNIYLSFSSQLFSRSLGNLNITVGEDLKLDVPRGILLNADEIITIDFSSLSNSLHFDPATFTIVGKVAKDFPFRNVECSMTATSKDGTLKDTQKFNVLVSDAESVAEKTSSTEQADNTGAIKTVKQPSKKEAGIVIGAVIGALCGICLLIVFALCLRRRKRRKSYISPKLPRSPRKSEISRPMFIPYGWPDVDTGDRHDLEDEKDEKHSPLLRSPENPPKLDLDLLDDRKDNDSMTDSIGDADTRILDSFGESSWGFQNDIAPSQHPECSMKIATELAKRVSQKSESFRKHKRRTTTVYQDQIHRSNGLPVNRRITGMGHGRHTYSPSRSNRNISRPLLRRPRSTSSYTTTRCTSTLSTAPSALPQPPVARKHMTTVTNPAEARRSIRIVPASIRGSSWADRRTIDEKRNSYIRKRASAQSPFFSANGMRESSSSYKSPPAFLAESKSSTKPSDKIGEVKDNIVRPTDEVEVRTKMSLKAPQSQGSPATSPGDTPTRQFPGSLRQNRIQRPFTALHSRRDRVEKSYSRPELLHSSGVGMRRRASTRDSLRAYELKTSLNNLTGSEIFKDAELSDSVYTDEEEDIKEAERQTVKPGQYSLPPLNIDTKRHSKRKSADKPKRTSDGDGRWGLKRASERDPTPYYMASADEHGGKENQSSTYTLGSRVSPIRNEAKRKTIATSSPQRPKPTAIQPRPTSDVRKTKRNSTKRASQGPVQQDSTKERHSRRSIHSRNQSRHSGTTKKHREHSRTQSTAYPYFDAASIDIKRSSIGNAITTAADAVCMPGTTSKHSLVTRDLSGNLTFYHASDEEPTIEELRSSSIGFRTSNGQVSTIARQSRLASLHESTQFLPQPPPKSAKRETTIHAPKLADVDVAAKPIGLGLFPVDARAEMVAAERERTPLETVQGGNQEEKAGGDATKGRQTWGSLKSIVGRSSRWVSQGYWEKQGKDDKVFI